MQLDLLINPAHRMECNSKHIYMSSRSSRSRGRLGRAGPLANSTQVAIVLCGCPPCTQGVPSFTCSNPLHDALCAIHPKYTIKSSHGERVSSIYSLSPDHLIPQLLMGTLAGEAVPQLQAGKREGSIVSDACRFTCVYSVFRRGPDQWQIQGHIGRSCIRFSTPKS